MSPWVTVAVLGGVFATLAVVGVVLFLVFKMTRPTTPAGGGRSGNPPPQFTYVGPNGPVDLPLPLKQALEAQPPVGPSRTPGLKERAKPSAAAGCFDVTDPECRFSVTLPGQSFPVRRTLNGAELDRRVSGAWLGSVNNNAVTVTASARQLPGGNSDTSLADTLRNEEQIPDPAPGHREVWAAVTLSGTRGVEVRTTLVIQGRPVQQLLYAGVVVEGRLYCISYASKNNVAIDDGVINAVYESFKILPK